MKATVLFIALIVALTGFNYILMAESIPFAFKAIISAGVIILVPSINLIERRKNVIN